MAGRAWTRLARRVGRRGTALLFFALLDLVFGASLIVPSASASRSPSLLYVAHIAPLPVWGLLWSGVGLVCLVQAFMTRDRVAFAAAMGIKTLWGVTQLAGWLMVGLERGYAGAAIWLSMAGWLYVISTWPEPPPNVPPVQEREASR